MSVRSPPVDELAPIVCLTGTTACGKTSVSVGIAQALAVEVVCADSRTLYRELSIGATKATPEEQAACPHHLIDVLDLHETWTVDDFVAAAEEAIAGINGRGALPLVVGGSRLYVEALCFELERVPMTPLGRAMLASSSAYALRREYARSGTMMPLWWRDRDVLARVLATNRVRGRGAPRRNALILAVGPFGAAEIETRVRSRADEILGGGSEAETAAICARYGCLADDLNSVCYKEWQPVWTGEETREQAVETMIQHTLYHTARQQAWLDSVPGLVWVHDSDDALDAIGTWRR